MTQPLSQAGYYEIDHYKLLINDIKGAVLEGRLIALCGVVGSGKTVTLRRLQQILKDENRVAVAKSLSVEKHGIKLATLISTLYYDLTQDKQVQIPKQSEKRERELQEIVKKRKRPVALLVDETHDLNGYTLIGRKRLMEVVEDAGGRLSVTLAGHPKLRNDLRGATMEEIGYRTDIFTLDGRRRQPARIVLWLLGASSAQNTDPESILDGAAIDILSTKLRAPLQVQRPLTLALEAGYQAGETSVTAALVETVRSRQLDDMEPTLTRHGFRLKDMVKQFEAKPAEIRALFNNKLEPVRTAELRDRIRAAGLPI
ncbi:AAA family ATPase [Duganella violaceipulchra]|uniref:Type II secretory pathway predicted ATPase ExeA n=1 Tax=Duganella violaceipulchra TaxID=2849652 RepID=A0ABT1GV17_9BURK|nr:AAA family ATPase [Duganella violaceicalia]MCP2012640.1 type II secretory pathway predicted ATPase ExeA [Duganella violaceicalia]